MVSNPAPVGLPGALSRRTDGGPSDRQPMRSLPDAGYGEQKDFHDIQAGAPMAASGAAPSPPQGLFTPTARPDEPITAGIASGPGPGPDPRFDPQTATNKDTQAILRYLPALRRAANISDAPDSFKAFVRYMETFNG